MATALSALIFIGGIVWWLAMRFQAITDAIELLRPIATKVEELAVIRAKVAAIEEKCGKFCPMAVQHFTTEAEDPRHEELLNKIQFPAKNQELLAAQAAQLREILEELSQIRKIGPQN